MRRILIVSFIVLIATLSGYGVYIAFLRTNEAPGQPEQGESDEFGNLFPAGGERDGSASNGQPTTNQVASSSTPENIPPGQAVSSTEATLRKTVGATVGGAQAIARQDGSHRLHYIEKTTGHIYEIAPGETIPNRLSNTTLPKIQKVYWSADGMNAIIRSFTDKQNNLQNLHSVLKISTSTIGTTQTGELITTSLPRSILSMAISPDKQSVFYLNPVGDGVVGITYNLKTKTQKQVFSHLFTDWAVSWPEINNIALITKPSNSVSGSLFLLNIKTGTLSPIISETLGLTALVSPDLKAIVYSESTQTGLVTEVMDVKTQAREFLPVGTLPEKCVWSTKNTTLLYCGAPKSIPVGQFPDSWYQGTFSFSDDIWQIDVATGDSTLLFETTQIASEGLDATDLFLSPDEKTLYFTDKKTSTLWELTMKGE